MWDALIHCTHLKSHTDLSHISNLCIFFIAFKRMNDLILKIFFELPIILLERIKVVKEVK